jgi:hypothetical protein
VTSPDAARVPCSPRREAWIYAALLGIASSLLFLRDRGPDLLGRLADETLLVPLARWTHDPGLFQGDRWLALAREVFSPAYSWLLGGVLRLVPDPIAAERVLAFPFLVVFLAGTFRVVDRAGGAAAARRAVVVVALVPSLLGNLRDGAAWPLAGGAGLPRDLVFALLPWIWLAWDAAQGPGQRVRRMLLLAGVGALSIVHPLTAVHFVALLVVAGFLRAPSRTSLRESALDALAGVLGLTPYLVQWMAFPRTEGAAPREALLARIGGIGALTPSVWMQQMETALWLGAAALVLGRGRADAAKRPLRVALLASLVLAALAPAFNAVVAGIQFDRLARVAVWLALVLAVVEVPAAARARDVRAIVVGILGLAAALLGPLLVVVATRSPRGPLEWVVRRAEVRLGIGSERPPQLAAERTPRAGDPARDPALADAFRALCAWARTETPAGALFAVPPEDWGAFRAYAARGAVVTAKEGGFALSFLGGRGGEWLAEYRDAVDVYASRDPARWEAWRRARGFGWAVLDDAETPVPPGWDEVRAFGPWRVLRGPAAD